MTGTLINAGAIVAAGFIGLLLKRGIPDNMSRNMQDALGILVILIGIQCALKGENYALIGVSLALGAVLGEWRQWEEKLEGLGRKLEKRLAGEGESDFVKGFVSATLLFCVGAMAIIGALEDGLTGNYQILLVKSMLDGIFALLFAASMGMGVLFSAIPVFIYQGSISLAASFIKPLLTDPMINNITATGGILIMGLGINLVGLKKIKVANLLPSVFLVPLLMAMVKVLGF
ncbi:hypothetical protein SAMN02745221_00820 [Thermosyntropha lipolytica DSM 11003]|uniref:DUF554 domain-containing protein n=1 Tax=Thermosyntropha lipolytica DSM 11003 TaxID=1123382 RepID=A0A1M5M3I1_9FIRM|nr:DUF554 domain-containing protein [Thermosyntropha lipolytica]SHG71825.1 hypothetical protein SAMN02745221_00820 [Thermosyntropha lipolytica DSM 11003]